jgi:hypothetical protein
MWDLYVVVRLIPYVFLFLREQVIRLRSRNWEMIQAIVLSGSVDGTAMPYTADLNYRYVVGTQTIYGRLSRKCLRKSSANEIAQYAPGSALEVRYDARKPERSYAPIPLGWSGFWLVSFPIFGFVAIVCLIVYAGIQNRYIEAHDAIPISEWQTLRAANSFQVQLPGKPVTSSGYHAGLEIAGNRPRTMQWTVIRDNAYFFYVEILQYPRDTKLATDAFEHVLSALKTEQPKRYVYGDEAVTWEGRAGKEFKYTRPYTVMRVYVDGQRLYIIATDWYVDTDEQKLLDSFHFSPYGFASHDVFCLDGVTAHPFATRTS